MLEVDDIVVGYGEKIVLKELSFQLEPGEMLAVIGPNGAGKSTLVRALSGVLPLLSGKVTFKGQDLSRLQPHERAQLIAVVPQARAIPQAYTAWQVVMLGRTPYLNWFGQTSPVDEELVRLAMERTHTLDLAKRVVGELSGGELQRVLLARALAQTAPVLLLDEPTTHLDLQYQISLLNQVQGLIRKPETWAKVNGHGIPAALVVLHDLNLVARYADRVLLLVDGQMQALGTRAEVFRSDLLSAAFGIGLEVVENPASPSPLVIPRWQ
jgi:iron complex transport system ATP-binding protein